MTSAARSLWLRIGAGTAFAAATLVAAHPPTPEPRLPSVVGAALGVVTGAALAAAIARRAVPPRRTPPPPRRVLFAKHAFIAVWAANEELVWRRLALGESLRGGVVMALVVSSAGFALVHRARRATHLATGAAFGVAYTSAGTLAAPLLAHWTYNALLALRLDRAAGAAEAPA